MQTLIHFKRFILSFLSVLIGFMIVLFSLFRVSSARAISATANAPSSELSMYLNQPIRPDHVFYPLVAAKDKMECSLLPPEDRLEKQLQLANERFNDVEILVQNPEKREIALASLMKAEQYLQDAAQLLPELNDVSSHQIQLKLAIEDHLHRMEQLSPNLTTEQLQIVNNIRAKQQALLVSLSE